MILHRKFYKDKYNWTSETDLIEIDLKLSLQQSPSTRNNDQNLVILRSQSSDPLTSNFD